MRPPGPIYLALLAAAQQGPGTLRELVQRSGVGYDTAKWWVPKMARSGALCVVGHTRVEYRNRLIHVYEAAKPVPMVDVANEPTVQDVQGIQSLVQAWAVPVRYRRPDDAACEAA